MAANPQQQERSATLTVAGLSVGITQAAAPPAEPDCTYAVSASSFDVGFGAGTRSLSLDTNRNNCAWSASSPVSWITLDKTSGQGDAQFTLTIAENTAEQSRSAVVTIAGRQVTVTQAAAPPPSCTFSVSPTSQTAPASGATRTSSIVASRGNCDWTASSPVNWITVNPGSGRGNADVRLTIAENTGQQDRSATVTIAGQPVTVTQAGASAPCTFAVSPGYAEPAGRRRRPTGRRRRVGQQLHVVDQWCAPVISLAPSNGTGDAQVTVTAQPNTGQQSRTATLTIAGQQVNVSQAAAPPPCTFTVSPGPLNLPAAGGAQPVTVTASAGSCAWSSSGVPSWITLAPSSGSGNATVTVTAQRNTATQSRTATLTIAGRTVSVTQAAAPSLVDLAGEIRRSAATVPTAASAWRAAISRPRPRPSDMGTSCNALRNGRNFAVTGMTQQDGTVLATRISEGN